MILIIRVDQTKKLDWRHAKSRLGSSALFPIFICLSVSLSLLISSLYLSFSHLPPVLFLSLLFLLPSLLAPLLPRLPLPPHLTTEI